MTDSLPKNGNHLPVYELDHQIVEVVLGWERLSDRVGGTQGDWDGGVHYPRWRKPDGEIVEYPGRYATRIADAWWLVDEVCREGVNFDCSNNHLIDGKVPGWTASFWDHPGREGHGEGTTVMEAICRAALELGKQP